MIVNIIFLYVKFGKNYSLFLIDNLKSLSHKLNHTIIEDSNIDSPTVNIGQLTLENDLHSKYNMSKITTMYFRILFSQTNNTILYRAVYFFFQFSHIVSVVFSIGLFVAILGGDIAPLSILTLSIIVLTFILLITCGLFFLPYKKLLQDYPFNDTTIKYIYLSLYWYLPIIILNASIGIIGHVKWLFGKN